MFPSSDKIGLPLGRLHYSIDRYSFAVDANLATTSVDRISLARLLKGQEGTFCNFLVIKKPDIASFLCTQEVLTIRSK
jgi:hypothetical protein